MNSNPVIALSGPRCCGKSTIAQHLVERHGFIRIAFADALREIALIAGDDFANSECISLISVQSFVNYKKQTS